MEDKLIYKRLSEYKTRLNNLGYNVIYIGLYGSQNYNLDDDKSDIDAKVIVLPTLEQLIRRESISKVIEIAGCGSCDVKDILTFNSIIRKGNPAYIESIETKYSIGDKYIKKLFSAHKVNLRAVKGMMYEKYAALSHPYPSKLEEINKWGFDPKQYQHLMRLKDILVYNLGTPEGDRVSFLSIPDSKKDKVVGIKRNLYNLPLDKVDKACNILLEFAKNLLPKEYMYIERDTTKQVEDYILRYFKSKLFMELPIHYIREHRTFDNEIPKKDIEKFPILEQYQGQDISYIVYESIEIL